MTGWVFYALIFLLTGEFGVRVEGARCFMYFIYSYACLMALFVSFYVCECLYLKYAIDKIIAERTWLCATWKIKKIKIKTLRD